MCAEPTFTSLFGRPAPIRTEARGRVNLMGDHTDYNAGYVLPAAIPQGIAIELAPNASNEVRAWSREFGGSIERYRIGEESRGRGWLDHAQAITFVLRKSGSAPGGFDARFVSTIPPGAGLSSSAALSVALLRALRQAFEIDVDDLSLALLARRAENEFIGAPVGIMDPMAVTFAVAGSAIFIDTRNLAWESVPIPREAEIAVIHSGISHRNVEGGYPERRAECEEAASRLGVATLRDLSIAALPRIELLEPPLNRRVRHVLTENERVLSTVAAFREERIEDAGRLFFESHRSLSTDYASSTREIDAMIDLAAAEPGVHGARITGGGFGGSVVLLASRGDGRRAALAVAGKYEDLTGRKPVVLTPLPD